MIVKHQNTIGPNVNIFYPAISKLSVQHNRHMAMIVSKNTQKKQKSQNSLIYILIMPVRVIFVKYYYTIPFSSELKFMQEL